MPVSPGCVCWPICLPPLQQQLSLTVLNTLGMSPDELAQRLRENPILCIEEIVARTQIQVEHSMKMLLSSMIPFAVHFWGVGVHGPLCGMTPVDVAFSCSPLLLIFGVAFRGPLVK